KSNTINEIGIDFLKKRNKLIETDCGDFIVQICDENSTHPVIPAIHIPIEKIAKRIEKKFKTKIKKSAKNVVNFVRNYIRKEILNADVGLTGANAISSEGSIFILENEGNISLISRIPKKHIIIAGIDKIVPKDEDAISICKAASLFSVGNLPSYINIITSPSKTADIQQKEIFGMHGAKEVYLILLDNGRSKILEEGLNELLYCINCGACLYFCPVYNQIFDKFGLKYLGGHGVSLASFIFGIKNSFENGLYFCTTCMACKENCPADIDIPNLIRKIRNKAIKNNLETEANKKMVENILKEKNPFGKLEEGKMPKELYCC
ncbi:MAG: LUD domain-containing protein, partial [Candidatus Aenigmarchaeota archaeon]|nr:LUD domain-containing protein [Candidatus Aenigmarchaeota archaeon]MDW8149694.1 LUD domain-containing protein [Candidatus Aenigmarchaeota archaeon]